jgi:hypothetical protein
MVTWRPIVNGKSNVYDDKSDFLGGWAMAEEEYAEKAKRLLRAEMVKRGITYDDLSAKLKEMGVEETAVNLRNKVSRGKFMASFLLQCLRAIGVETLRLEDA